MRVFKIGEPFKSIQDYADYPHSKLYFHGRLIGKSIVDNWQFRMIRRCIEYGELLKAELNEGYKYYNVDFEVVDNDDECEYAFTINSIARSPLEAKCKALLKAIENYNFTDENIDIKTDVYIVEAGD